MFSRIRKRLTFTNVALALVLVFAMTGGAYAAKKYVITSTKQISPTVLKQLQGKAGPAGAPGVQGPAGSPGPGGAGGKGEKGDKGDRGELGPAGSSGPAGAAGATGPTGATGKTGTLGIPGENGITGPTGPTGQTGFTETLPPGQSEKGTWVASGVPDTVPVLEAEALTTIVSFPIPLDETIKEANVHIVKEEVTGEHEGCPKGSKVSKPEAEPGNLCVFIGAFDAPLDLGNVGEVQALNPENGEVEAGKTGAWLLIQPKTAGKAMLADGTWAVTAAETP